jgi:hypothetical protein
MKRRAFIPSATFALEDRIALSHAGPTHVAAVVPLVKSAKVLDLNGFVLGKDTSIGAIHKLEATSGAMISPLGPSKVTGFLWISSTASKNKPVFGFVTISDAKGSILVSIDGTVVSLGGSLKNLSSGQLKYQIVHGTGAYKGAIGSGKVLYGPGPAVQADRFLLDFGNAPPPP